jgi:hypothetical protein
MDDFDIDFEPPTQTKPKRLANIQAGLHRTVSNKTYRIVLPQPIDLFHHATTQPNCIMNAEWRCTQHFKEFSVNIFKDLKWMLMTRELDTEKVYSMVQEKFGFRPVLVEEVNITVLYRLGSPVNLEALHDSMQTHTLEDIFNGASNEDFYFLDKQKFPALIAKPDKHSAVVLEIYATGNINATGMKKNAELDALDAYVKTRILPAVPFSI